LSINNSMTATNRNPTNPNFLHPNKFQLNFSRAPNIQYFCQSVSIPGISLSEAPITNPFVDIYVPGEKAIYDLLNITFIVDEDLKGWLEIHDWIRAMTKVKEFAEYRNLSVLNPNQSVGQPQYSDGMVTLLTSKNNPNIAFKFYDLFPTTISTFVVSSADTPETIITADASFRFSYYDVVNIAE